MKPLGICRRLTIVTKLFDGGVGHHDWRYQNVRISKNADILVQALLSFKITSIIFDISGREHLSPILINYCLNDYSDCGQPVTDEPQEAILSVNSLGLRSTSSS